MSNLVWAKLSAAQVAHREPLRQKGDPVSLMDCWDLALTERCTFYGRTLFSRPDLIQNTDPNVKKEWAEAPIGPWERVGPLAPDVGRQEAINEIYEAYGK